MRMRINLRTTLDSRCHRMEISTFQDSSLLSQSHICDSRKNIAILEAVIAELTAMAI